jgi:hypothetical protein
LVKIIASTVKKTAAAMPARIVGVNALRCSTRFAALSVDFEWILSLGLPREGLMILLPQGCRL